MTEEKIDKIVKELYEIISRPSAIVGSTISMGIGDVYDNKFVINNISNHISEATYLLDNIDDALLIMQKFSGEVKRTAQEAREKFKFDENKPLYIHYFRALKGQ